MDSGQSKMPNGIILIVDDDVSMRQALEVLMTQKGYGVRCAPDGQTALLLAEEDLPELVLLDIRLPDVNGIEVCRRLKQGHKTANIPVIFISALDEVVDKIKGFAAGGVDYLTKPFEAREVLVRVETHLALRRLQRQIESKNRQLEQEIARSRCAEEALQRAHDQLEQRVKERTAELHVAGTHLQHELAGRKKAEEELADSQALLSAVLGSTEDLIWSVDSQRFGLITYNTAFMKYFSTKRGIEVHPGMTPDELVPPDKAILWKQYYRRALSEGPFEVEYEVVAKTHILNLSLNLLRRDRNVIGVSVFGHDITQRKRMQDQLRTAAEEWQSTFDSIDDLVMILDPEFRILRVNAATVSFLGLTLDQILGSRCHTLMHGTDASVAGCPTARVLQTRRHEETEIFHDGKKAWLLVSADPILDAAGTLKGVVHAVKNITERKRMEEQLEGRLREIGELKEQLEQENISLREEVKLLSPHEEIVGRSAAMRQVLAQVEQVARTDSTVLISGETGTGKELVARAIHDLSTRKARPLVTVNCASLPPTLIESELFGREKGAYTGAMSRMVGRFEVADGSTLLLDEISELPLEVQAKLLRVLEEGRFERLGSTKPVQVNVRILAATNRDLAQMVQEGDFRRDLYYRLNVFPITIPPLRERSEDIPLLVRAFIHQFEKRMGKHIRSIPKRSLEGLQRYTWPGNARELRNVIEHAMIVNRGPTLEVRPPSHVVADRSEEVQDLQEVERRYILSVLHKTAWRVAGKGGAAEILGLKPTTLEARMKKLGVHRPKL